jgi:AcrR family transcriptional regulator
LLVPTSADLTRKNVGAMRQRNPRGRKTMHALHGAALELIEELPLEKITVDLIVARAGIGKATFYRHYATKEDLIDEIATDEIDRLVALSLPLLSLADTLPSSLEVARYVDERRHLWKVLLTGGAGGTMRRRLTQLATIRGASAAPPFPADLPLDLCAVWGVAATAEILAWWLRQEDPASVEVVAGYLDRLAVRPAMPSEIG